jgi:hypothetical protein
VITCQPLPRRPPITVTSWWSKACPNNCTFVIMGAAQKKERIRCGLSEAFCKSGISSCNRHNHSCRNLHSHCRSRRNRCNSLRYRSNRHCRQPAKPLSTT